jgi:hypothetical protein
MHSPTARRRGSFLAVVMALFALLPAVAFADKIDVLVKRLTSSGDYKERLSAALNLAKVGDQRAIPAFIVALDDDDKTVRGVAAAALGKLVTGETKPELRKQAAAELKRVAGKDGNSFVRKQAQQSYDAIRNLAPSAAPTGSKIYVHIGQMSDSTGTGDSMKAAMRQTVDKSFRSKAPKMATQWGGRGSAPTKKQLDAGGVAAFYVDGTLIELDVRRQGAGAVVGCKVSMLIATYPEKSMFGFLKGGASVQAGSSEQDIGYAKQDCVVAVVEDLVVRKIIPTISQRVP